tara:strand:- start:1123 stop:1635 length:513 start_codon:yes stop_codon:yes gene_type:complete
MAYWTKPNHTFVAEYQQSSLPFVTSSVGTGEVTNVATAVVSISFPGVSRWVEIRNVGAGDLRVGFTANGVIGKGGVTGSNPIDGQALPVVAGYAKQREEQGNHANYFLLSASNDSTAGQNTCRWEIKTTKLFFSAHTSTATDFSVIAGITTVPKGHFVDLSGSAGFRGVG